jgi:L,D-transpeptidase catalytic domain
MRITRLAALIAIGAFGAFGETAVTRRLVISVPDHKLVLIEDGKVVKVFTVAVGKASTPSPRGIFHIASRVKLPTWYSPGRVVPPGPHNPVGTRWMGLGYHGYGIHGTDVPRSVGQAVSHGCFRMRNKDVEQLFPLVHVGDEVEIVDGFPPDVAKLLAPARPLEVVASVRKPAEHRAASRVPLVLATAMVGGAR